MNETVRLATYVSDLVYDAIPREVTRIAKDCVLDSLGAGLHGSTLPWSKMVARLVEERGGKGRSSVFGQDLKVPSASAALANGTMIHGFEFDGPRHPGGGVHTGATMFPALLAASEEVHAGGKEFLTAFVAGCETMSRIGLALGHGVEKRGFHTPGITGTFGAAVAVGKILALNTEQLTSAMGIAGSLCSGLLEFSRAKSGGMVKRLHPGRAAEGGVTAAYLASEGFTGPGTVLEGQFGVCRVFSDNPQPEKLTAGLGKNFETLNTSFKRYPCHIYAQAPIEALLELRHEHGMGAEEVERIVIAGEEKLTTHHAIYEPGDVMTAQYSVPYSVALALVADPGDPDSFSEENLSDPGILALAGRVELVVDEEISRMKESRAARVTVRLKDGRELKREVLHFKGTPQRPLTSQELRTKVEHLARYAMNEKKVGELVDKVRHLEELEDLGALL